MKTLTKSSKKLIRQGKAEFCKLIFIGSFLILTINPTCSFAQNGDPPTPPAEHGENGNQVPGGGAPVGDGLYFMLLMAGAYVGKKVVKKIEDDVEKV